MTCQSCGGLVAVEGLLSRLNAESRFFVHRAQTHLKDRRKLIWVLALCPIIIVPPVLAIMMSLREARKDSEQSSSESFDILVLFAAVSNIILSIMFWKWFGQSVISLGFALGIYLKSIGISSPTGIRSI